MANALKDEVPSKYDAVLDDLGLVFSKKSYGKNPAAPFVPKFSTGQINFSDGTHWQAFAQTEWLGGAFQEFSQDKARQRFSENVEFGPGYARIGKATVAATDVVSGISSPENVRFIQNGQKTYMIVNDTAVNDVYVYRVNTQALGAVTLSLVLTLSDTYCQAACFYQGFFAFQLGASNHPASRGAAPFTTVAAVSPSPWGLCLYKTDGTFVKQLVGEVVGASVNALSKQLSSHLCVGEDRTLMLYMNFPMGLDSANNPSTGGAAGYGPRPIMYLAKYINSATPILTVTPTTDIITDGDYVGAMANVAGATYLGTMNGKVYSAVRTLPSTAADTYSVLMEVGGSFAIIAMAVYGSGIVFLGVETESPTGAIYDTNDTTHVRAYQLNVTFGQSRQVTPKKIFDLTTANNFTEDWHGTPKWIYTSGSDIYLPDLANRGVLKFNGYGFEAFMGKTGDGLNRNIEAFCVAGAFSVGAYPVDATHFRVLSSSGAYLVSSSSTVTTALPYLDTSKFDAELPHIEKIANEVQLSFKPWPNSSTTRFKLYYRINNAAAWTLLGTLGAADLSWTGRTEAVLPFPTELNTVRWSSIELRYEWTPADSSTNTANVEIEDVVLRYALSPEEKKQWNLRVLAIDNIELNDKNEYHRTGKEIADRIEELKEAGNITSYVDRDGVEYLVLILNAGLSDPMNASGKPVEELESFYSIQLLEVRAVTT